MKVLYDPVTPDVRQFAAGLAERLKILGILVAVLFITNCSEPTSDNPQENSVQAQEAQLVLMDDQLEPLKRDFNDRSDQVRLFFIVGPT